MTVHPTREVWPDLAEGEVDAATATGLRSHLAECAACREEYAAAEVSTALSRAAGTARGGGAGLLPDPPAALTARVLDAASREARQARFRKWRLTLWFAPLAAATAVAVLVTWRVRPPHDTGAVAVAPQPPSAVAPSPTSGSTSATAPSTGVASTNPAPQRPPEIDRRPFGGPGAVRGVLLAMAGGRPRAVPRSAGNAPPTPGGLVADLLARERRGTLSAASVDLEGCASGETGRVLWSDEDAAPVLLARSFANHLELTFYGKGEKLLGSWSVVENGKVLGRAPPVTAESARAAMRARGCTAETGANISPNR